MTPVQIPFKRNFKDMENKFEYLKIDGREQLPAPIDETTARKHFVITFRQRMTMPYCMETIGIG